MIFMSQSGITDPAREKDWDAWYLDHLRIMMTVPGIGSAQRFKAKTTGYPSSLAMYRISSAEVFQDPYYQSVRGMGDWLALIEKKQYCRNLFEGLDLAPEVPEDRVLIIADRTAPEAKTGGIEFAWLKAVALDRSTPYRGIAVAECAVADRLGADGAFGVYRPVTARNFQRG